LCQSYLILSGGAGAANRQMAPIAVDITWILLARVEQVPVPIQVGRTLDSLLSPQ
jgi:hypothetical protein